MSLNAICDCGMRTINYEPQVNLRGRNYRIAMQEWTPLLVADAEAIIADEGKLTLLCVTKIAVKHNFPVKTTFEFLEYAEILPSGTWARLVNRGYTAQQAVKDVFKHEPGGE